MIRKLVVLSGLFAAAAMAFTISTTTLHGSTSDRGPAYTVIAEDKGPTNNH